MKIQSTFVAAFLLTVGVLQDAQAAKRIAVVVANNQGAEGREDLRYAERDADQFLDVLTALGGAEKTFVAKGKTKPELEAILSEVERSIAAASEPVTLLFFYSGHADESALLMNGTRYPFDALKDRLTQTSAQLLVAFVDACQSGRLTRNKGGTLVPIDLRIYQEDRNLSGGVFITSSASGENAQESDELGASFFTHYLVSALRGAADASEDGRVTLEEAYQYVYRNTVDRTRSTLFGAQHPTYSIDVKGQGQLTLTWLEKGRSTLVIPAQSEGTYFLKTKKENFILAEVHKDSSSPLRIALEPGRYEVSRREDGYLWSQEVSVDAGQELPLDEARMKKSKLVAMHEKGGALAAHDRRFGLGYGLTSGYLSDAVARHGLEAHAGLLLADAWEAGVVFGYQRSAYTRQDGFEVDLSELSVGGYGQWTPPLLGAVRGLLGIEARFSAIDQAGVRQEISKTNTSGALPFSTRLGLSMPVLSRFELFGLGRLGAIIFEDSSGGAAKPLFGFEAGVRVAM